MAAKNGYNTTARGDGDTPTPNYADHISEINTDVMNNKHTDERESLMVPSAKRVEYLGSGNTTYDQDGNYKVHIDSGGLSIKKRVSGTWVEASGETVETVNSATATIGGSALISVVYTATGSVVLTLPSAASCFIVLTIADSGANAGVNNIVINCAGSDTIVTDTTGNTSVTLDGNGDVIRLMAINSTTWKVF